MMYPPQVVLILFADALAAPEVLWSLTDAGMSVVAIARRGTKPAAAHSRFARVVWVTDPAVSVDRSLVELSAIFAEHRGAIVMPLDDLAVWAAHRLAHESNLRVCGPTGYAAEVTLDKRLQIRAAAEAGLSVPATVEISSVADFDSLSSFPCIVKPALAARVLRGSIGRGRAHILRDPAARDRSIFRTSEPSEPMLAQPHIAGVGEGLFGLALDHGVTAWSAHRRVRMMNPAGSGSSACVNIAPQCDVLDAAERFLLALGWRGMFMIELLRDSDGKLWFMELNGRPWGSMALARRQGLEYPAWAIKALIDRSFVPTLPAPQPQILCRHIGRELIHLAFVSRGPSKDNESGKWPSLHRSLFEVLRPRRHQAVYNWRADDPRVFLHDLAQSLLSLAGKRSGAAKSSAKWSSRLVRRYAAHAERMRQKHFREAGLPVAVIQSANSVLFVCYGNINRSALAERHFGQLVRFGPSVSSCGFHPHLQRPADPEMVSIARANGVDLEGWSSRGVSTELIEKADIIFAMEAKHLTQLYAEHPGSRDKAFLLGALLPTGTGSLEIQDPFGKPRAAYERCLKEVTAATTTLSTYFAKSKKAY